MNRTGKIIRTIFALLPAFLLFLPKSKAGGIAVAAVCLAAAVFFSVANRPEPVRDSFGKTVLILWLSACAGVFFYLRWQNTGRMKSAADALGLPARQLCAIIAAVLCLCFCFSLRWFLGWFPLPAFTGKKAEKTADALFILLLSALIITLASKCSPFYPFNDWVDPQTMFTLGKGMLRGRIPYRDLYEQKGPLLLALHALGALISFDTLIGIWLIEIAACFATLWMLYGILSDRLGRKSLAALPVLALVIWLPPAFVAGDTAEEMSLPFLTYALSVGLKAIRENRLPNRKEAFWVGITSGCVLWIKFSILGFYAGWFLYFALSALRGKKLSQIPALIGRIGVGVLLTFIPVFLYFAAYGAVGTFLECYFLNNVRYYPAFGTAQGPFRHLVNLWRGLLRFREANIFSLLFFLSGLCLCFLRKERGTGAFMLLTFLTGYAVIFFSGTSFPYYVFIFGSFSVLGLMWLPGLSERWQLSVPVLLSFFICAEGILLLSPNIYVVRYELSDFPQYKAKQLIEASGIEEPSLLHYGLLDAGFNLLTRLVPEQRFFSYFNLKLPGQQQEQDRYIAEGETDFVVTCHVPLYETENYELIASFPGDFTAEGNASLFFLYQRREPALP